MKWSAVLLVICALSCIESGHGAKILGFFPSPSKSHLILGTALLKGLAKNGHQVTMLSPYPLKTPVANYRDVVMGDLKEQLMKYLEVRAGTSHMYEMRNDNVLKSIAEVYEMGLKITNTSFADKNVQKLLNSGEKFDAIIVEIFLNEACFVLGHHFGAPVIAFSTVGASEWTNDMVGNPSPYAYVPELFLSYTDHMSFSERLVNTIVSVGNEIFRHFVYLPKQEAIKDQYFPGSPDLYSILANTSMVLLNSHVSLTYPRPLVPNMVEIGGFHVDPVKKLPADLQKYLDDAKEGVVYFSMGSNLQSKELPVHKRTALLEGFSRLKQKVLWKWEDETLPGKPDNVRLGAWLPQQDLLSHPNVKLFITHGGLLSTTEAISRGVPLIGIPIFGDQQLNMGRAVQLGYGLLLDFNNITADNVYSTINEIISNPKYTENVKKRSAVLHDQQVTPLQRAVYWIEYVIRHKGAHHLRSAVLDLNRIQYLLLDVFALLGAVVLAVVAMICFACKLCFRSRKAAKKTKKKTN